MGTKESTNILLTIICIAVTKEPVQTQYKTHLFLFFIRLKSLTSLASYECMTVWIIRKKRGRIITTTTITWPF